MCVDQHVFAFGLQCLVVVGLTVDDVVVRHFEIGGLGMASKATMDADS